jgi:hypothetical protein
MGTTVSACLQIDHPLHAVGRTGQADEVEASHPAVVVEQVDLWEECPPS